MRYAVVMFCVLVFGVTGALADGAALYRKCIACHGADGGTPPHGGTLANIIRGKEATEIEESLKGYRDDPTFGGRLKGMMRPNVRGLSDEQINTIANYVATLP